MGILPKDKHIGHLNYIDMDNIIGGMTGVGEWRNA